MAWKVELPPDHQCNSHITIFESLIALLSSIKKNLTVRLKCRWEKEKKWNSVSQFSPNHPTFGQKMDFHVHVIPPPPNSSLSKSVRGFLVPFISYHVSPIPHNKLAVIKWNLIQASKMHSTSRKKVNELRNNHWTWLWSFAKIGKAIKS